MDRRQCEELDRTDPLSGFRERFELPEGVVYLDGNSLGALPRHVPTRIETVLSEEWGRDLIRSWNVHSWVDLPQRVGERIGRLIGAETGSVVCADSTSVNLFKAVSAASAIVGNRRIVTDSGNFPTDVYVMGGIGEVLLVEPEAVATAIDETVGVVALTQVDYRSGRRHDMAAVTAAAHAAGALIVWDLAHSAGAFPVDLAGVGADLAVGCGYKYLNGGPGAPAFIYVAPRHHEAFANPIPGWFGHAAPFEFSLDWRPAEGIARALVGTPPVVSMAALDAALDIFDEVDLGDLRAKSVSLSELFIELIDDRVPEVEVITPRRPNLRGSQVSLRHPEGYPLVQALIDRRVIGDFREPDVMRFGLAPLYVTHVDVFDAVDALRAVLDEGSWRSPRYGSRNPVT